MSFRERFLQPLTEEQIKQATDDFMTGDIDDVDNVKINNSDVSCLYFGLFKFADNEN